MTKFIKYIPTLLVLLAVLSFVVQIIKYNDRYRSKYNHQLRSEIFSNSPYIKGTEATTSIGDDYLFAFAGYYMTVQGGDPTKIDFENPPLGKYLIGLSILIFGNEWVISLIYAILFLIFIYKLAMALFKENIVASLAVFLVSIEGLFLRTMTISLLDLPEALFMLIGFYFYTLALKGKKLYYFGMAFFLGCAFATKFFPAMIFITAILIIGTYINKKRDTLLVMLSLLLIPLIYLASYTMYFVYGHTLADFIRFQKWAIVWRTGNPWVYGNIFLTVLIGKYRSWWDNSWVVNNEWGLLQPIIFIFGMLGILFIKIKDRVKMLPYAAMVWVYFIYLAVLTTGVMKYIYPVLPIMVIFTANAMIRLIKQIRTKLTRICYTKSNGKLQSASI